MSKNEVVISVPIGPGPIVRGYVSRRIDLNLTPAQAIFIAIAREGASAAHATLQNGRHVETNADMVKWIVEQIGDAINRCPVDHNGKGKG